MSVNGRQFEVGRRLRHLDPDLVENAVGLAINDDDGKGLVHCEGMHLLCVPIPRWSKDWHLKEIRMLKLVATRPQTESTHRKKSDPASGDLQEGRLLAAIDAQIFNIADARKVGLVRVEWIFHAEEGQGLAEVHLRLHSEHRYDHVHAAQLHSRAIEETVVQTLCEAMLYLREFVRHQRQ